MERKNKRGDVTDIFVFVLIAVFLAISFIVVLFVNNELLDIISTTALNESSASSSIIESFELINTQTVQRGYALFMGILMIGMVVSAFLVRVHPAFIFIYIITLAFAIFVSVYLGNMYNDFIAVDEIAVIANQQPMINFFMENLLKIVLVVGALSMIIVLSKIFGSPGGSVDSIA